MFYIGTIINIPINHLHTLMGQVGMVDAPDVENLSCRTLREIGFK